MKRYYLPGILTTILYLFLAIGPAQALAGTYADVWSFINWDSIEFTYTGTGSITNDSIQTNAYAENTAGQELTDTGINEAYTEFDADNFWGWGAYDTSGTPDMLIAEAYVNEEDGMAYGDAGYYGTYTAQTDGTLTVSFRVVLAYELVTDTDENAWADTWYEFNLGSLEDTNELSSEAYNGMSFSKEIPYNVSLSIDLNADDAIDFSIITAAQAEVATVPVPGAAWLLASGILGWIGIRKRS